MEKKVRTSKSVRFAAALTGSVAFTVVGLILNFLIAKEDPLRPALIVVGGLTFFVVFWVATGIWWKKESNREIAVSETKFGWGTRIGAIFLLFILLFFTIVSIIGVVVVSPPVAWHVILITLVIGGIPSLVVSKFFISTFCIKSRNATDA